MPLHFTRDEFAARRKATIAALESRGLSGLLMFRQESMYYLSGYDTFGYVFFQCYYLGSDGRQFPARTERIAAYTPQRLERRNQRSRKFGS